MVLKLTKGVNICLFRILAISGPVHYVSSQLQLPVLNRYGRCTVCRQPKTV